MTKRLLPLALLSFAFLAACGDDDSNFAPRDEDSSSSICEDCDDESSSSGKGTATSSSSSHKDKSSSSAKSSSSSENYVWSVSKESFLNPNVKYDSIVDARDGQVYKIVKIDDLWWMAENLNYKSVKSWCYGDNEENCKVTGRFYTWGSAMDSIGEFGEDGIGCGYKTVCKKYKDPVRGVCPEGWFLPTLTEWKDMLRSTERYCTKACSSSTTAKYIKSQSGWIDDGNGTDDAGLAVIPAGYKNNGGDVFADAGRETVFWCNGENGDDLTMSVSFRNNVDSLFSSWNTMKNYGYSVRCFKPIDVLAPPCKTDSTDNCEYGTLTDERDGQTYRTVKIANQWWMAQNLNYAYPESDDGLDTLSYCYESRPANCDVYGRLYTWSAAMDSAAVFSENGKGCGEGVECSPTLPVRGVCPEGWHLPDTTDWGELFTAIGGKPNAGTLLKTDTSWGTESYIPKGTDAYGFSVISVRFGRKSDFDGNFGYWGYWAHFWTSRQYAFSPSSEVLYYTFVYKKREVSLARRVKYDGLSVRCVKD